MHRPEERNRHVLTLAELLERCALEDPSAAPALLARAELLRLHTLQVN